MEKEREGRMERQDVTGLLQEILSEQEKQRRVMTRQLRMTQACVLVLAVLIAVMGIGIASAIPKLNGLLAETDRALFHINQVTGELAAADLAGMLENVDQLVISGQESMGQAAEKISSIDIESLNKAIGDLQAVIEPLAKFFGRR